MPLQKRKGIRYHPPLADTCELTVAPFEGVAPRAALLHDESHHGCSVVCVMENAPKTGETILVKVGKLDTMPARVTYSFEPKAGVHHIGCEFQEAARA